MQFRLQIENVRPVSCLAFEIDLSKHGIRCIVGKNGAGKTTLVKAIMNLALADTFVKTSMDSIFSSDSTIEYTLGDERAGLDKYVFAYDSAQRTITTRQLVQSRHKAVVSVEMPAPHGQRFTFFRTLADRDEEIRQAVVLDRYTKPTELIEFLSKIYEDNRFDALVEVPFNRGVCCCFVQADKRYIREDYFSSGEYFLINLYRKVARGTPLVVIDEIDVSLDASTQARLAQQLRDLCAKHKSTIVFTSHSLALMQTLGPDELYYLERDNATGAATLSPMSFNGVKSLMFGFRGYDRYILTEDAVLEGFLRFAINRYCSPIFYSYQVICVGGQGYINKMVEHNKTYRIFGPQDIVLGIKDGDQAHIKQIKGVHCLPPSIPCVEKALHSLYPEDSFEYKLEGGKPLDAKRLYKRLVDKEKKLSPDDVFQMICDRHDADMLDFAQILAKFLSKPR
jgi:ABC-type cobalamin/Fe3+-siderophores transport system ATPase subunit